MSATPEAFHATLRARFTEAIPHARDIGLSVVGLAPEYADMRLPYRPEWLGDVERGVLHTGVITTLVDTASGLAVCVRVGKLEPIATIDLRMDYLRPAFKELDVTCRAECYRVTPAIAFVRATVWQADPAAPVAVSQSVFMRAGRARNR